MPSDIERRTAAVKLCALLAASFSSLCLSMAAQANTSTVFSPDVKAGTRAFEYRSSYVPSEGDDRSAFAHRLHYQQAINDMVARAAHRSAVEAW